MMHQFFEISIEQLVALDKEDFLELCSRYLEESLADEERRWIDREARAYGRQHLGFDPGSDLETLVG
jgi:hypothetical protein